MTNLALFPWLDKQFVGMLVVQPSLLNKFPDILDRTTPMASLLTDRDAIVVYEALKKRPGASVTEIAAQAHLDGKAIDPEKIQAMVNLIPKDDGEAPIMDPDSAYEMLQRMRIKRNGPVIMKRVEQLITAGHIPSQVLDKALAEARKLESTFGVVGISTNDWGGADAEAAQGIQRDLARNGLIPTIPPFIKGIGKMLGQWPMLPSGYLADTSTGKTIFALMTAEHWAAAHGVRVQFISTEEPIHMLRWRTCARKVPDVTMEMMEQGFWDERCRLACAPYASGGYIRFIDGAGMEMDDVINLGVREDAHIIVDLGRDLRITRYRQQAGSNDSFAWEAAFTAAGEFCQKYKKAFHLNWQFNAEGRKTLRGGGKVGGEGANGGAAFENKVKLLFTSKSRELEEEEIVTYPIPDESGHYRKVRIHPGEYIPIMRLAASKNTKGRRGMSQLVYLDGERQQFISLDKESVKEVPTDYTTEFKPGTLRKGR